MALFGWGKKKKEEKSSSCCRESGYDTESVSKVVSVNKKVESVKVLGSGCAKCNQLEGNVKTALEQLGMNTTIDHVADFSQIAAYGVMSTPALVVDDNVVSYGKVLKVEEVIKILERVK